MPQIIKSLTTAAAFTFALHLPVGLAQNCYYPNGDVSHTDAPCDSANAVMCCPLNWACINNGLCYLANEDYFGRYTCTDRSWGPNCPDFCTMNNTASGNEAVLQCSDGSWCCDRNRSFNCCTTPDTTFFRLAKGDQFASISSLSSLSLVPSTTTQSNTNQILTITLTPTRASESTSSTPAVSSLSANSQVSPQSTKQTSSSSFPSATQSLPSLSAVVIRSSQSIGTGTNGQITTLVIYSTVPVAVVNSTGLSSDQSGNSRSSNQLRLAIALPISVPIMALAVGMVAYLLWRRKRNKIAPVGPPPSNHTEKFGYQVGHVAPDGRAPELDSYPVAIASTNSGSKSELDGSSGSPTISMKTDRSSAQYGLPRYSPLTPNLGSVQEQQEPAELWGGYVPYRPPAESQEGPDSRVEGPGTPNVV